MQVKKIQWLSQAAAEAEVEVTDGNFVCVAFAYPCEVQVGDELIEPLHVFGIKDPMLSEKSELGIWKIDEAGLGQRVIAELIDVSKQIFAVGGIALIVDEYLPGGLEKGNLVEFECARIDLW